MFPQAEDMARYWANIRKGLDAIIEVPESHWRVSDYFDDDPKTADRTYAHRGGFLTPVDFPLMEFGIAPNSVEATDTTQLLGLMVARQALADAGYLTNPALDRDKVSVILGVTGTLELVIPLGARLGHPIWRRALQAAGVDPATTEDVVKRIADSYVGWQENSFPGLLGNVAAGRIANRLDLRGTNCVVDAACASSLGAVNLAALELTARRCDLAVTGGLDTFNDIFMYMCFSKTPALSPSGDARPFDAEADGTILGEGLGVLVLKRLDDARRDGDRIYAVIRSMGSSSDGKGQAVYAPSAAGQAKALKQAYQAAAISPATVELVEAHGTGTKVGDAIELAALSEVYEGARTDGPWCALGSVKSQVGHTKAAAGAAGLIKAALALHHKVLPPTSKIRRPIESLAGGGSPFYVSALERPWLPRPDHPRRAAVSAFGFGGSNFHCVLEEAEPAKPGVDWNGDVQILAFSSDSHQEIAAALVALENLSDWNQVRAMGSRVRASFQSGHRFRVLMVAERGNDNLIALCTEARARLESLRGADSGPRSQADGPRRGARPRGAIFVATGPAPGALAMLFPGQGSQYVGMLRELACQFPQMQQALALLNDVCASGGDSTRLSDQIYPPTAYDEPTRRDQNLILRDTRFAQPAIGAISLGMLRILAYFGVHPQLAGGHSFGELTALCAAGRFDDRSLAQLAQRRGAIMASCAREGGDGAMLAVFAHLDQVADLLKEHGLDVVIANKNAPRQCVLSGPADEIERSQRLLGDRGLTSRPVPVSAAFHSRAVAAAERPLREALDSIRVGASAIPVFANATAQPYPEDAEAARALLAGQLARPVEFVAQVEAMYRMGARTFLEVGPEAKLTGLVQSILGGRDHLALAVDAARGAHGNLYDLACSLATLASVGYAVDLTRWDDATREQGTEVEKMGLTVKICGANARTKLPPRDPSPVEKQPARPAPLSHAIYDSPQPPRFSMARADRGTMHSNRPAPDHTETDWTMNPPPTTKSQHTNGQASSHAQLARAGEREPAVAATPSPAPEVVPAQAAALTVALKNAQDNLVALQRLAEQTATLHRQFLLGQEKSQQIFLELLGQEQRLSLTLLDTTGAPAPMAAHPADLPQPETLASSPPAIPLAARSLAPPTSYHTNGKAPAAAAAGVSAPTALVSSPITERPAAAQSAAAILIDVVADKTGYPAGVLDLDMQLDADLGIDSIKRVEILSALQDRLPGLPAIQPDQLGSFRTLRSIIEFLSQIEPATQHTGTTPAVGNPAPLDRASVIAAMLIAIVADKTGYPADMLELDMRLDTDLGIDSIKRVEIFSAIQDHLPGCRAAGPEQLGSLGTLRAIVEFLAASHPTVTTDHSEPGDPHETEIGTDLPLAQILLESVAEKTGYPIDMLELDMRLDTDLGIDSIKRVEILSAVQDRLPRVGSIGPEQLGTLATLRQIVEALAGPPAPLPSPSVPHQNTHYSAATSANGTAHHAENQNGDTSQKHHKNGTASSSTTALRLLTPTVRMLEAGAARDPVRLPVGGTVWVTADGSPLTAAICAALHERNYRPQVIELDDGSTPVPDESVCGLIIAAPLAPLDDAFVKNAFRILRTAGPALERSAARGAAALLTVSRLEGTFGLAGLAAGSSPIVGALAGMAKTAGHEWRGVQCKAVDVAPGFDSPARTADLIVNELLQRGPAEVGLSREGRAAVELEALKTRGPSERRPVRLERGDLVVISGGARGVTAEVAVALAESFGPRLVLLGRTPVQAAEPDWLAAIHDESQLKRALLGRSNGRRALQDVGAEVGRILAQREIRRQLARIENAGSPVVYRSVDVRDEAAVRAALTEIRREYGPVRGLIHGAGVLADRKIADQTDAQFALVYDTKVAGLRNLYQSIEPEALRFLLLFSSSTARFGRSGQVAYAAANEAMNKWAQRQSVRLPHCHVVSYNWGPWAGGMVKDSLRPLFEKEGLSLIPLDAGARLVVDQLRDGSVPVEVVVLAEPQAARSDHPSATPVTTVTATTDRKLETVFRRSVDLDSMPVLASHVIDGHAVLPLALIQEWLAEAAVHRNPGLVVCGIDRLQLHKGVIVGKSHEATVEVRVGKAVRDGAHFIVPTELKGMLASGREVAHARADVVLGDRHETGSRKPYQGELPAYRLSPDEIYQTILFHGPAMQGIERVDGLGERAVAGWVAASPATSEWLEQPLRNIWLTDPLAIDCAFQLVVLWSRERLGANSLPTAIGGYRQFRRAFPAEGVRVVAQIRHASDTRAVADIEFFDAEGALVARLDAYECVVDLSLNQAFRRNRLAPLLTLSRAE
jgi:acyl transferase domain-containing protein